MIDRPQVGKNFAVGNFARNIHSISINIEVET
jgi:hypothetical protein